MAFVDRDRDLAALEMFWASGTAQCIPVTGRRRVGKTSLLEQFAAAKRVVYFRCQLRTTETQLPLLGAALADIAGDPVVRAQPPTSWTAVFALIERLTGERRLLLVLDEIPYWMTRDESLPSLLQNWWDARGRALDLMLVLCGSAEQMMELLFTGAAPLAGCVTGRLKVRPFDFRAAAQLLGTADPIMAVSSYGILGGIPLYLSFFQPRRSLRENILQTIASPTARLYVEPTAVFAAAHRSYETGQVLAALRAMARGAHRWSEIASAAGVSTPQLGRVMDPIIDDLGLVERVLPVTETRQSRTYYTQYHLTDNFFRFWFRFIEPNQGAIEFGAGDRVVDGILAQLSDYLGPTFEALCREWVRLAAAAEVRTALPAPVMTVGTWWNPAHEVDVVGLDAQREVIVTGECKWRAQGFNWSDLQVYLGHVRALAQAAPLRPDASHLLFSKEGFDPRVRAWATGTRASLLEPKDLFAPL